LIGIGVGIIYYLLFCFLWNNYNYLIISWIFRNLNLIIFVGLLNNYVSLLIIRKISRYCNLFILIVFCFYYYIIFLLLFCFLLLKWQRMFGLIRRLVISNLFIVILICLFSPLSKDSIKLFSNRISHTWRWSGFWYCFLDWQTQKKVKVKKIYHLQIISFFRTFINCFEKLINRLFILYNIFIVILLCLFNRFRY
jgi:hypothetical protein